MDIFKHLLLTLLVTLYSLAIFSQERTEINIPDIPGYYTLKCDFHMHTPFSDGTVWPSDRVKEAYYEGLDVIAITDHIEYNPNKEDVSQDLNRPFEIAKPIADRYDIILIKAGEITRDMPPGHFNAFFLKDLNALRTEDYEDAFKEAAKQGAYFVWNHPGWKVQQPDTIKWFPLHTEFLTNGWLNGIELVNEMEYYPVVHQWALEKNLTMFGNSDIHGLVSLAYDKSKNMHRPLTLVFSKDRTKAGIREAFIEQRTAVYHNNLIIGKEEYLKPLFSESIEITNKILSVNEKGSIILHITNKSDIDYKLLATNNQKGLSYPQEVTLLAHKTVMLEVKVALELNDGVSKYKLNYIVDNLLVAPCEGLLVNVEFEAFSLNNISVHQIKSGALELRSDCIEKGYEIHYTLDGGEPTNNSVSNAIPIDTTDMLTIRYAAFKDGIQCSKSFSRSLHPHKGISANLTIKNPFDDKYQGGGKNSLIDGFKGSHDYKDGIWQGYHENDLEVVIDLKKPVHIRKISIGFLNKLYFWIFLPTEVEFAVSDDGKTYNVVAAEKNTGSQKGDEAEIKTITASTEITARYIRVKAKNIGKCPEWHIGAGKKAWLFVDEIVVR